jgi:hypothetical protein
MEGRSAQHLNDWADLEALDAKINALLPPRYQHCYASVPPTSMGSAKLKYGPDGKVAWGEIWTSFCDLALAGGPPHRGPLLEPVSPAEVAAEPEAYHHVVNEIARGLWLTTDLPVLPHIAPGWVGVVCYSDVMAAWLVRAVVAENVSARCEGQTLYLPAGPRFRLEKEIKNVVVALAKTCHYWSSHISASQKAAAVSLTNDVGSVFLGPAPPDEIHAAFAEYQAARYEIEKGLRQATGLSIAASVSSSWVGVNCSDETMAVWLLRAVVVENVLARREGAILYLPVALGNQRGDRARRVVSVVAGAYQLWRADIVRKQLTAPTSTVV